MDGAVVSFGRGWGVYTVVPSVGVVCRVDGRDGERDCHGGGAWVEEFGLSIASSRVFGRDICDVRGSARPATESCCVCSADRGISCRQGGWRERCDRCGGLCWVELRADTARGGCDASHERVLFCLRRMNERNT